MAKAPAFQFYVGDWLKEPGLRACSLAARGLWIDCLCYANDSPVRGELRFGSGQPITPGDLARMAGVSPRQAEKLVAELERAGVFDRAADGAIVSRRMKKDEIGRQAAAAAGKLGGNPNLVRRDQAVDADAGGGVNPPLKGGVVRPDNRKLTPSSSSSSSPSPSGGEEDDPPPSVPFPTRPADGADDDPGPERKPPKPARVPGAPAEAAEAGRRADAGGVIVVLSWDVFAEVWEAEKLAGGRPLRNPTWTRLWQDRQADPEFRAGWRDALMRLGRSDYARGLTPRHTGITPDQFLSPSGLAEVRAAKWDDRRAEVPRRAAGGVGYDQ